MALALNPYKLTICSEPRIGGCRQPFNLWRTGDHTYSAGHPLTSEKPLIRISYL